MSFGLTVSCEQQRFFTPSLTLSVLIFYLLALQTQCKYILFNLKIVVCQKVVFTTAYIKRSNVFIFKHILNNSCWVLFRNVKVKTDSEGKTGCTTIKAGISVQFYIRYILHGYKNDTRTFVDASVLQWGQIKTHTSFYLSVIPSPEVMFK